MTTNESATAPERDEATGRYVADTPPEEFIEAIERLGGAGTQEIADGVGCRYQAAYKRLRALEDQGRVGRRKIANANLWVLATDGDADTESDRGEEVSA